MPTSLSTTRETSAGLSAEEAQSQLPKKVVFLAHSSFVLPFRVGSHQLAYALADLNWEVLHIPSPVTIAHVAAMVVRPDYRKRLAVVNRRQRIRQRIVEFATLSLIPWQLAKRFPRRAASLYGRYLIGLKGTIRKLEFARPDVVFIDEPRLTGMLDYFQTSTVVYRATDLYREMVNDTSLTDCERLVLSKAAAFVATSVPVYEHLRALAPEKPGLLLENGVDFDHFNTPQPEPGDLAAIPKPRAIYVGALDDRFDHEAVRKMAEERPGWSFVLIGPQAAKAEPYPANVFLLGARRYEEVPAYLQHSQLALLPMSAHPANEGRSPMKIYEYGAAGLKVLARSTKELSRRFLPFVKLYERDNELAPLLDECAGQDATVRNQTANFCRSMSWSHQAHKLLNFVETLKTGRESA